MNPVLPSQTYSNPEQQLDQIEKNIDEAVKNLPHSKQAEANTRRRRAIAHIRSQVSIMRAQGKIDYMINREVDGLIQKFYESEKSFSAKNVQYETNKDEIRLSQQALGNTLLAANPALAPIKRVKWDEEAAADQLNQGMINYAPYSVVPLVIQEKREEKKPNPLPDPSKAILDNKLNQAPSTLATKAGSKVTSFIETFAATDSPNPARDSLIKMGVKVVIAEGLKTVLPGRIPAYIVTASANAVAETARELEPAVESLSKFKKLENFSDQAWDITSERMPFSANIAVAKSALTALQVPGDLLKKVDDKLNSTLGRVCDAVGLTEKNVKFAIEQFGKNSPEVLEEKMWARAYEGLK